MASKCTSCGKNVYPQEMVSASDRKYHKLCFKCSVCSTSLNLNNFNGQSIDGNYTIFCKSHVPKAVPRNIVPGYSTSSGNLKATTPSTTTTQQQTVQKTSSGSTTTTAPKTTTTAPKTTTTTTAPKTTTTTAPKTTTTTSSNNNKEVKTDDKKRPLEASSFLKRSRHQIDYASKLTPKQLEDFTKLFALYDKDKSGAVDIMELGTVLAQLGYNFSPESLDIIIRIVDENRDGQLNFQEFLGFYDFLDFLKNLFNSCDSDKSGTVDRRELNVLLKKAGYKFEPKQVELLYRMCDEDGSGTIELGDFLSLMLFVFFSQILFATCDTDGNDSVDFKEFTTLLNDLGIWMSPVDAMKFFQELDTDKSGTLHFEEYIELVFELKYPLISDLVKFDIERTGGAAELNEVVNVNPDEKINLMEASGFLTRSRHRFNFESKLSQQQIDDYKKLFNLYDKDKSGTIDIMELGVVLSKLGYTFSPESLDTIIAIVDDNLDNVLNFQEFLGLYDFLEYLKSLFESADKDKNGSIDRAELKTLLEEANYHFNDKQIELFYKMCDEDGSGVIEVGDFFALTLLIFWAQILFAKADTDGNDVIELTEFNNVTKRLGLFMAPEKVVEFFNELDTDKNGTLVFEEYIELIFMIKFLFG